MSKGIPGLTGIEHIGFTVPDLDEAETFLVNVLGCQRVYNLGPFIFTNDWMKQQMNLDPRTVMRELRFYRLGNGANLEVFEYQTPEPQAPQPRNSDIGGHHLALYVEDLDLALSYLREHNVEILGEPVASKSFSEGQRWIYFLSPWGMQFELVSFPQGKAYEKDSAVKLWQPSPVNSE